MNSKLVRTLTVGAIAVGAAAMAQAQQHEPAEQNVDAGKYEYDRHCAECHGLSGKGDGPFVQLLRSGTVMPNLTELSQKNGGVFPFTRVYGTIDGTVRVRAHGSRIGMPIWGEVYQTESRNLSPIYNPDVFARAKILALIEYIYRLQEK